VRFVPAIANAAWLASGARASARFHRALSSPGEAQRSWLLAQLVRHAGSVYGREHDFAAIRDYATFARRVPLASCTDVAPYLTRIQAGEKNVLGADPVTHLVPTSGTTGPQKLIPFTGTLSAAFDAAVAPWMRDLARQRPSLSGGPAYWSVSPLAASTGGNTPSTVRVGFDDDAAYLGGAKSWLITRLLAVPSSVRLARDESAFWRLTLLALLRSRELRLVSVWHPSFFELLVGTAEEAWPELIAAVESGANPWADALPSAARAGWAATPDPRRASELRTIGAFDWPRWWPLLQVLSCWGEAAAEGGWRRLASRVPDVLVQRKGLLATEAVVTIPIGDAFPLAITSHFFEFLDEQGGVHGAEDLERGGRYEVVVTNGAGLWRYRLGDIVECTGRLRATPSLRFLGRSGRVSDLRGEKLSEPFVSEALRTLWSPGAPPAVAVLRAWDDRIHAGYELVLSTETLDEPIIELTMRLERALEANPHYALARRLGQLAPLRVVEVSPNAAQDALREASQRRGVRIGDVKPPTLVLADSA
jgi:hypothetical protein